MGVCETRWIGNGQFTSNGYTVYFSENQDRDHRNGVAIVMKESISKSVIQFLPISDRVIMTKIQASPININFIQVYVPTADKDETQIEEFYHQIHEALKITKKHEITLLMGDFNAKVGQVATEDVTGHCGLGERNERGRRLIEFCQETGFIIMNTLFKLPKRRLYTWKSPRDGYEGKIVRNQIDYIMINQRFRNNVTSVQTYPSADIGSNHNLLCSNLRIKLKKVKTASRPNKTYLELLKNPEIRDDLASQINTEIHNLFETPIENKPVNENWMNIKNSLLNKAEAVTSKPERTIKKQWMTHEILNLMEQRRNFKNKNLKKYRELNRLIRKKNKRS